MASGCEDMPAALPSVLWSPPFPESSTSSPPPPGRPLRPGTAHSSPQPIPQCPRRSRRRCPHFPAEEPGEDLRGWGLALSRPPPCASQAWCRPQPSFPASRGHPLGGDRTLCPCVPDPRNLTRQPQPRRLQQAAHTAAPWLSPSSHFSRTSSVPQNSVVNHL